MNLLRIGLSSDRLWSEQLQELFVSILELPEWEVPLDYSSFMLKLRCEGRLELSRNLIFKLGLFLDNPALWGSKGIFIN